MTTPEKLVKDKVVKILKARGVYYFYASTHGYGNNGVPDLVCCYKGKFIGIECKAGKGKPTPLQLLNLEKISAAGGIALVISEANIHYVEVVLEAL